MKILLMKILFAIICLLTVATGCNSNKREFNIETRNLYIERVNFPSDLQTCFDAAIINFHDTTWLFQDTVVYHYRDAATLPDKNLLDNTRKFRVSILGNDSVGNPIYSIESFKTEMSKWKRVGNSGSHPMRTEQVFTTDEMCEIIRNSMRIYVLKYNP